MMNRKWINIKTGIVVSCVLLMSCQEEAVIKKPEVKRKPTVFEKLDKNYAEAIKRQPKASRWHEGFKQALPLSIIGPVFEHPESERHPAFKLLDVSLKKISQAPRTLDSQFGKDFSKRFKNIKYKRFALDGPLVDHVTAVFSHARRSEVALNAIFDARRVKGMEMAVGFDEEAIKDNKLRLIGYKTVEEAGLDRNSTYFEINAGDWPKSRKAQLSLIFRSVSAAMALSIPEYASIDRKLILDTTRAHFVTEYNGGLTYGHIYNNREKVLELERKTKLAAVDKEKIIARTQGAQDLVVSLSGEYIAYSNKHKYKSRVWLGSANNLEDKNKISEKSVWDSWTKKIFFLPDDALVLFESDGIRRYQPNNKQWRYQVKTDEYNDADIDKKGRILVAAAENQLDIFSLNNAKKIKSYAFEDSDFTKISLRSDGKVAVLGMRNGGLLKINVATGQIISKQSTTSPVSAIIHNPKGTKTFIAQENGQLLSWKLGQSAAKKFDNAGMHVTELAVSPNGKQMAARTTAGEVVQWKADIDGAEELGRFSGRKLSERGIIDGGSVLAYSVDSKQLFHGGVLNLQMRASETSEMVNNRFNSMVKTTRKTTWLDASTAYQLLYPAPLTTTDILRLQQLKLADGVKGQHANDLDSTAKLLAVVGMELPDPILVGSRPSIFKKALNLNSVTNESKTIKVLRYENNFVSDPMITVSRSRYDDWGYRYTKQLIGQKGFTPHAYMSKSTSASLIMSGDRMATKLLISHDKQSVYEANSDGTLVKLNAQTSEVVLKFKGHNDAIYALAESKDGRYLASGGNDGVIKLWNAKTAKLIRNFSGFTDDVGSLVFIDSERLASASSDQSIKIWDINTGKPARAAMLGHNNKVWYLNYSADTDVLISSGSDNAIRMWNQTEGAQKLSFTDLGQVKAVSYDQQSYRVAYQAKDGNVMVRSIKNGERYGKIAIDGKTTALVLFPGGKLVLTATENSLSVYEVATGRKLGVLNKQKPLQVHNIILSQRGDIAILAKAEDIQWWNVGWFKFQVEQGW